MTEGERPTRAPESSSQPASPIKNPDECIGPYRLVEKLGEGGMGEVWLAEQAAPIRRRVAVKVIKAGVDTRQVIARFEGERQALVLMGHPNIATVIDAGATHRGLPYFAMEYVPGEPITAYCDGRELTLRQRLELFGQVCEGVQHAHRRGIIHRDLKPSNVLVTAGGERPTVKIIDFGVAKATALRLTERSLHTELGALVGTPEYMSPEQAEASGRDVDTRADVFSLGVLLYELLTGAHPFGGAGSDFETIRRRILHEEPRRPSARVRTDGSSASARRRRMEPATLARTLRGDLDGIVMKALEKDRARRYASPDELRADIRRHFDHQPLVARPPSAAYRARKFARRHRFGVSVAAAGLVALVAFSLTMAAQGRRLALQRDRALRVSGFLEELFKNADPSETKGQRLTALEVLDRGYEKIEEGENTDPAIRAQLLHTIGRAYLGLGLGQKAEVMLRRCVEAGEEAGGTGAREAAGCREDLVRGGERRVPPAEGDP